MVGKKALQRADKLELLKALLMAAETALL